MNINEGRVTYSTLATEAGRLEREGLYGDASKLWTRAATFAELKVNQDWAAHRSEFCYYAQVQLTARAKQNLSIPAVNAPPAPDTHVGHWEMHYLSER